MRAGIPKRTRRAPPRRTTRGPFTAASAWHPLPGADPYCAETGVGDDGSAATDSLSLAGMVLMPGSIGERRGHPPFEERPRPHRPPPPRSPRRPRSQPTSEGSSRRSPSWLMTGRGSASSGQSMSHRAPGPGCCTERPSSRLSASRSLVSSSRMRKTTAKTRSCRPGGASSRTWPQLPWAVDSSWRSPMSPTRLAH